MKIGIGVSFALLLAAGGLFLPARASAQGMDSMALAVNLGDVLASEAFCGLTYDQAAIGAFINKNVKAEDMGFTSTLQMMTEGKEIDLQKMSPSAKTAHCVQIARVARSYGFTK